jgi:hypothetical protein
MHQAGQRQQAVDRQFASRDFFPPVRMAWDFVLAGEHDARGSQRNFHHELVRTDLVQTAGVDDGRRAVEGEVRVQLDTHPATEPLHQTQPMTSVQDERDLAHALRQRQFPQHPIGLSDQIVVHAALYLVIQQGIVRGPSRKKIVPKGLAGPAATLLLMPIEELRTRDRQRGSFGVPFGAIVAIWPGTAERL